MLLLLLLLLVAAHKSHDALMTLPVEGFNGTLRILLPHNNNNNNNEICRVRAGQTEREREVSLIVSCQAAASSSPAPSSFSSCTPWQRKNFSPAYTQNFDRAPHQNENLSESTEFLAGFQGDFLTAPNPPLRPWLPPLSHKRLVIITSFA